MFTRRHKLTPDNNGDLPEVALSKPRKKTLNIVRGSDEIEKISQDFQVAQLESLKDMDGASAHLASGKSKSPSSPKPVAAVAKKNLEFAQPTQSKAENPVIKLPAKPVSPGSFDPPKASEKPTSVVFLHLPETASLPKSLLENLLNEIVEQDIQRLQQRLNRKK